ncbi:hypothetical protein BDY21DRAFT_367488 [Lineolata rhizophorae]|uniref:Uncharacterized protein n=1 Tax=Lineolata rhizophorae TaxID=578093 RepID=A0A6A6NMW6_9PEZI|nr:hypothetical protein BDY21DRAFT_367488 [Lineolata rhizophorae]
MPIVNFRPLLDMKSGGALSNIQNRSMRALEVAASKRGSTANGSGRTTQASAASPTGALGSDPPGQSADRPSYEATRARRGRRRGAQGVLGCARPAGARQAVARPPAPAARHLTGGIAMHPAATIQGARARGRPLLAAAPAGRVGAAARPPSSPGDWVRAQGLVWVVRFLGRRPREPASRGQKRRGEERASRRGEEGRTGAEGWPGPFHHTTGQSEKKSPRGRRFLFER